MNVQQLHCNLISILAIADSVRTGRLIVIGGDFHERGTGRGRVTLRGDGPDLGPGERVHSRVAFQRGVSRKFEKLYL